MNQSTTLIELHSQDNDYLSLQLCSAIRNTFNVKTGRMPFDKKTVIIIDQKVTKAALNDMRQFCKGYLYGKISSYGFPQ